MKLRNIALTALVFLGMEQAKAQDSLQVDSFTIVKEYVPTLSQSAKIRINPEIKDTHNLELDLNYDFLDKSIPTQFNPESIEAANLKGEPLVRLHRSYIIAGFGNNTTPLGEIYFNQLRSKKTSYGIHARHFSSNGISNIENSNFSENAIGANGSMYSRKYTLSGDVKYKYNHLNYYGFNELFPGLNSDVAALNEDVFQFYNRFTLGASIGNNQRDTTGLRHFTSLRYRFMSDRYGSKESNFILGEEISLAREKMIYTFDWKVDYNDKSDTMPVSPGPNTLLYLKPGIELRGSNWTLKGGLNLVGEFAASGNDFQVYPVALFRYHLVKSIIIPYAELTGTIKRNNYHSLTAENPFLGSIAPQMNTRENYRFTGGVGGNMSKSTSFDISFSQTSTAFTPLFVKDTLSREYRSFTVVYDELTITEINAELIYEPIEKWKVVLNGTYFIYKTTTEDFAWHKPNYHISLLTKYNLQDKIIIELIASLIGSQKAKTLWIPTGYETLNGTLDLNLALEYRYTKKVSVFLDLNNLASVRYEKWQDYPTQRFNLIGGFKFSF